jgi:WD40 repeat protein
VPLGRRLALAREAWQGAGGLEDDLKVMGENALRAAVLAAGGEQIPALQELRTAQCSPYLSENERWLVFVTGDKVLVVDVDSAGLLPSVQTIALPPPLGSNGYLPSVAINNRGTRLAAWSTNEQGPIWIWDLSEVQRPPKSVRIPDITSITPVLFTPDGHWLIAGRFVVDLNIEAWRPVSAIHAQHRPHSAAVSQDGNRVVFVDSAAVFGLNVGLGIPCVTFDAGERQACEKVEQDRAQAEQNRTSAQSGIVLDLSGVVPTELGHWRAEPTDNERVIVSRNRQWAVVWYHPTSFMPTRPLNSPIFLGALEHQQNGMLASRDFSWDRLKKLREYDQVPWSLLQRGDVGTPAFSPDSRLLAMDVAGNLLIWTVPAVDSLAMTRAAGPQEVDVFWQDTSDARAVLSVAFSKDNRWLAAGGQDVRVWNLKHGNPFASPTHTFRTGGHLVDRVAMDDAGRWLIAGRSNITVWDLSLSVPASAEITLRPKFWDARPDDLAEETEAGRSVFESDIFLAPSGRRVVIVGDVPGGPCSVTNWNLDIQNVLADADRLAKQS